MMEAPLSSLSCAAAAHDSGEGKEDQRPIAAAAVDPFLVEALENPRHRLTVLRMELDIQKFMENTDGHQFEFPHLPTSYLRCAAHRVAQHYGLQTMALDNATDGFGGRVVARKTPETRYPSIALSDIPTTQPESDTSEQVKIVLRQRPNQASMGDAADIGVGRSLLRTVEERKEEYDKARARAYSALLPAPDRMALMKESRVRTTRSTNTTIQPSQAFKIARMLAPRTPLPRLPFSEGHAASLIRGAVVQTALID